jgi:hypothetical protein
MVADHTKANREPCTWTTLCEYPNVEYRYMRSDVNKMAVLSTLVACLGFSLSGTTLGNMAFQFQSP